MTESARQYAVRSTVIDGGITFFFSSPYVWPLEDGRGSLPPPLYGPMCWEEADAIAKNLNLIRDVMEA